MGGIASPEVRWLAMTWGGVRIALPEGSWLAMTGEVGRDCFARRTLARNDRGEGLLEKELAETERRKRAPTGLRLPRRVLCSYYAHGRIERK